MCIPCSIDKIKQGTIDLSNQLGVAVGDISEAQYQAISAGASTENSLNLVKVAAMSAKAGFTDTATAVDGLTTIYNSFGMSGAYAYEKISNEMLKTQNYGKTTYGDLAGSLGRVTPTASAAGMSLEEVMTSMAVLTKNGIATSEAASGLKAALSNIIKPTTDAKAAADALGIEFDTNAIKSKGWAGFLADIKSKISEAAPQYAALSDKLAETEKKMSSLEKAGKKSSESYKALKTQAKEYQNQMDAMAGANNSTISGFASMFGSVEALNSIMVLTSDSGAADYQKFLKDMGSDSDVLQESYEKMLTPSEKMSIAMNKLKNDGVQIGEKLMPMFEKIIGYVDKLADAYNDLTPAQQDQIIKFAMMAAAAGPMITAFGKIVSTVGTVGGGLSKFHGAVTKAAAGFKGASSAAGFLKVALGAIASPAAIVIAVIAGIIAVVVAVRKNWDLFKASLANNSGIQALNKQLGVLKSALAPIAPVAQKVGSVFLSALGKGVTVAVAALIGGVAGLLSGIIGAVNSIIKTVKSLIKFVQDIAKGDWKAAWEDIKNVVKGVFDFFDSLISGFKNAFKGIADAIGGAVSFLGGGSSAKTVKGKAAGDRNWMGGIVQVGEQGGEIMDLPHGTRIYPHDVSMQMAKGGGNRQISIAKLADSIVVREDADIDKITDALVRKMYRAEGNMGMTY
ncbi:MAG: phage tail tape measure protein [Lachnospiraceae bacterium]|nr:phage tail tape measure protein [Lachnospiraceae bacterium]